MKKRYFLGIAVTFLTLPVCFGAIALASKSDVQKAYVKATEPEYTLVLNKNTALANVGANYQNNVVETFNTANGNELMFNFVNAKTANDAFVTLSSRGKIYNFGDGDLEKHQINGIKAITVTYSGTNARIDIRTGVGGEPGGVLLGDAVTLTSGTRQQLHYARYFELTAVDAAATIQSISIEYSCLVDGYDVKNLNGTYTGVGTNYTWKMTANNGAVSMQSLDKPGSQLALSGTAEMLTSTRAKCTFNYMTAEVYYTVDVSSDYHSLTYVEKSDNAGGSIAANVEIINFKRVYSVENFEKYTATGTGYVSADAKYTTSGLRSEFYADFYTGSSSGEIGGSGWPVMTSTDNTNYVSNKGHNNSKVGIFKFSNGMGMRYISANSLYGVPEIKGKGTTLSFWARGPYTNTSFDTNYAQNITMKFYAYYNAQLTPSNQASVRTTYDFTVLQGDTWQHFEMPLDSSKTYYGFGIFAQQSTGATAYVSFDDIEIYTASPYTEYVPPIAVTGVSLNKNATTINTGKTDTLVATVAPNNATNQNVTWESSDDSIATVENGVVTGVAAGNATITVKTVDGNYTATCAVTVNESQVYFSGLFTGTVGTSYGSFPIAISSGDQQYIEFTFNGRSTGITSYSNNGSTFTLVTKNSVTFKVSSMNVTVVAGTLTGSIVNGEFKNCSFSGTKVNGTSITPTNNGSINLTKPSSGNILSNNCDGTTDQLKQFFDRRYHTGSAWTMDTTNADKIKATNKYVVDGTGALQFRGYSSGKAALTLASDLPSQYRSAFNNISFWIYNSSANSITIDLYAYTAASYATNTGLGSYVIAPGQWTFVSCGYSGSIYNMQVYTENVPTEALFFDNFSLFKS